MMEKEREMVALFCRGFLRWYDFHEGTVLFVGMEQNPFAAGIVDVLYDICFASIEETLSDSWIAAHSHAFRYIISIEDLEKQENPADLLLVWRKLLTEDGCLLLGLNNRFGLRYFCGDADPYTKHSFDSIENYQHIYAAPDSEFHGRMYSMAEIRRLLQTTGWHYMKFFSVLSDLRNPYLICAEDYYPKEDLEGRIVPVYNRPDTVFLEEETLYSSLQDNEMFHKMANAYLVECPLSGNVSDVRQVTVSADRSPKNALMTVLHKDMVEKRALYPEGKERLVQMDRNIRELKKRSLKVVSGKLEDDRYIMPYIEAETGQVYLKRLYKQDKKLFLEALNSFRDCVMKSADVIVPDKGDGKGAVLSKGYVDLIPLNSFYVDGEFVFFDQEFCQENYPANAVLIRTVFSFYSQHPEVYKEIPIDEFLSFWRLNEFLDEWTKFDAEFIGDLLQKEKLDDYYSKRHRNNAKVEINRKIMDCSAEIFQLNIIDKVLHGKESALIWMSDLTQIYCQTHARHFFQYDKRKLVIFGSGKYAMRFMGEYRNDYSVAVMVDNQESRWGAFIDGVEIVSPVVLKGAGKDKYKVLVCVRDTEAIERQLESYGIFDYYIFQPRVIYPRARVKQVHETAAEVVVSGNVKQYHIGYIAGVFDLFHIGHLNMFRRAKEQCDYLIVGIVSDRGVRDGKKVEPFVPFEERLEMVKSCRYVDEAHEIPYEHPDTDMAWQMYHFDVQFSGSDYEHDPVWLKKKEWLEERGSTMVFFPYTQSTSSTRLKKLIEERLI